MNVQLTNVISDITGLTGQNIIRAIIAGERDPTKLAKLRHERVHASEADIAKSLKGHWRDEHLFALKQAMTLSDTYNAAIADGDRQIQGQLERLYRHEAPAAPERKRARRHDPTQFDLRTALCCVPVVSI